MTVLAIERLRRGGQTLMEEIAREHYLAQAGLKREAHLQPIYERHRAVVGDEALELARTLFVNAAEKSEEQRSGRMLLEWQAEMLVQRELAQLDEREIAWESVAVAELDDGTRLPYQQISIAIANAADRAERLMLERARAELVKVELAPLRRDRFAREIGIVSRLELAQDVVSTFSMLSGIDLRALATECERFLADTEAMWSDVRPFMVRRRLGIDPDDATRADVLALMRAPEHDRYFAAGGAEAAARRHFAESGLDVDAGGRIVHDTGDRQGKRARAFCAPVRIPWEIYLVLRPHGGQSDWRTYLHELGHALHFAYVEPTLPFEYRWLGDNTVTEGYAMLLDHLVQDNGWLRRYSDIGRADLAEYLRSAAFEELHFLRRYSAKLLYELKLYAGESLLEEMPDLYCELLAGATGFRYDPADAFVDVDPRFYSARYLRAWQLQALLQEQLLERFDADWYRNPACGPWLREELFGGGQRELGDELARRISGGGLAFGSLVGRIAGALDAG